MPKHTKTPTPPHTTKLHRAHRRPQPRTRPSTHALGECQHHPNHLFATITALLASLLLYPAITPHEAYASNPQPTARSKAPCKRRAVVGFTHSKGSFKQVGSRWVEYNRHGALFAVFQERRRSAAWIVVEDKGRQMLLRFPLRGRGTFWSKMQAIRWHFLYRTRPRFGRCLPSTCRPNAQRRCFQGHVYHYGSCGKRGSKAKHCKQACDQGRCVRPQVRVLYLIPKDRKANRRFSAAIAMAIQRVQSWYQQQLKGHTFSLANKTPEICALPRPSTYYARNSWNKLVQDVQRCTLVTHSSKRFTWVLYADVVHACKAPGRLGAGLRGITILPRQDMHGLIGARYFDDCGKEYKFPVGRYIGGLAHELGHAFGLPHPPGCDQRKPSCDLKALMWAGYASFPKTYLRTDEKKRLRRSPFFRRRPG